MKAVKRALVICDMQPDLLRSIPDEPRNLFLEKVRTCTNVARKAGWHVIFTGLQFPSGYATVNEQHRLFGGFRRLNQKVGDKQVHWFMKGYQGAEIEQTLTNSTDVFVWRSQHLPPSTLVNVLQEREISSVTVIGIKASYAVQSTCQVLCDAGLLVKVIRECIQDDNAVRLASILDHLLPIYSDVVALEDWLEDLGVNSASVAQISSSLEERSGCSQKFLVTDCKRGFHGPRFCELLLERPNWQAYPAQKWFQDERWNEFYCPLDKKIVDFADEPQFSRIAMYLKGRECLEDKIKVLDIASKHMPRTFLIDNCQWKGEQPTDSAVSALPWFVKEANRNWGSNLHCCLKPSDCLALTLPGRQYVVQQHVPDPLLTKDGRKCHIKFYVMLMCNGDADWSLYTYKDGYLSISPNQWNPDDVTALTQVTILRSERISEVEVWDAWPRAYLSCKACVSEVIAKSIQDGKLQHRPGQKQFEIFSADFLIDRHGKAWLFEFNMSPVLKDERDFPSLNDTAMLRAGLSIAIPCEGGDHGLWELAAEFPKPSVGSR